MTSPDAPAGALARLRGAWRRWALWFALVLVVVGLLATLVWLARGHEIEQTQRDLDRDNADAAQVLRQRLARNLQDLHGLAATHADPISWWTGATQLLHEHREWMRLQWHDAALNLRAVADSPFYPALAPPPPDGSTHHPSDIANLCGQASKLGAAAYAPSRFVPRAGGLGEEVLELCLPVRQGAQLQGYVVATHTLDGMLALLPSSLTRGQSVGFTELDGTRLAMQGVPRRGARVFVAQQVIDLPGAPIVLRLEGSRQLPDVFPNVLTALVTGLSIALITVLVLLARDFRARQQAESELAQALAFRKAMEDSLVTGLRARDLEGRITYVNPAFCDMVGFAADELIGQSNPVPYWPPEMAQDYAARQVQRLSGLSPVREGVESVFMRKDGTRFPVLIYEAPLITTVGKHTGWMSAVLDMTAQRRAEELSRASQERLQASARLATVGEMASLMSHELNQPLAVISSYATGSLNLLQQPAGDAATLHDVRTALSRIAEQAGRAGKVIHSVRDLVRQRSTSRQAVAPRVLFDAVLPLVQLQARKLGATVHVDVPADLPAVWCEATMIEQVLLNLARNGLQAMAEAPAPRLLRLQARLGPAHTAVEFVVADSGEGISDDVAAQLFTPFFTTKDEGMGLGLSLCRTVVEQHGSALQHQPQTPRGTVFRFTLPVAG
ncbi:PAS domain S-box protein [Ottowia beijingensis]|uniref:histidine kinase n=1 Tax=Ottowia beijingensis TaxID=1207057 RepID=A0A853ISD1_9BURK|nr:PAS domain-containing sensor histidine kinase [Ottowia beijingensis]NZA01855.1 PAS domain S-box protein [Ottowia beijingensis]